MYIVCKWIINQETVKEMMRIVTICPELQQRCVEKQLKHMTEKGTMSGLDINTCQRHMRTNTSKPNQLLMPASTVVK